MGDCIYWSSGRRVVVGFGGLKSSDALPFRVFADAISILRFCFHGLKSPRLLAFGFASFRRHVCLLRRIVMLNLFQHLAASLFLSFSAHRS